MTSAIPHNRRLGAIPGIVLTLLLAGCTGGDPGATFVFEPEPAVVPLLPGAYGAQAPAPEALAAVLDPLVADVEHGASLGIAVTDAVTGQVLYARDAEIAMTPGSTNKVLTAAAALAARGPDYRIPTRAVAGDQPGEVVIIGGGDPTLSRDGDGYYPGAASLADLAEQVKAALGEQPVTSVTVDATAFTGPGTAPGVDPADLRAGWGADITALMTDGARKNPDAGGSGAQRHDAATPRFDRPDLAAGHMFADLLGGVPVAEGVADPAARELGAVLSPPMRRLVEETILASDNVVADALIRQVALARGLPGSFADGTTAAKTIFAGMGLPAEQITMVDGSGLSYHNEVSAAFLTGLLSAAAGPDHPELRPLFAALPVAGYTGTLDDRYGADATEAGAGLVRAKTGTLRDVNALAGTVVDADGRLLAFALLLHGAPNSVAVTSRLDEIPAALAECGCR